MSNKSMVEAVKAQFGADAPVYTDEEVRAHADSIGMTKEEVRAFYARYGRSEKELDEMIRRLYPEDYN